MKKFKRLLSIIVLGLSFVLSGCSGKAADGPRIGVIQLMEHTSLNMIYDSFEEELAELGYQDGVNCTILFKNAQGEQSNIGSIVSSFQSEKLDVVVAIATPTAQSAAQAVLSEDPGLQKSENRPALEAAQQLLAVTGPRLS